MRLSFWAAFGCVLALEERLTHAAHELFLLGGGAEDELLLFWLYFALECRDGELQAVVLVLAEGIVLARASHSVIISMFWNEAFLL